MIGRKRSPGVTALGVALGLGASWSCDPPAQSEPPARETTPNRLGAGESLPEAETAFGLPIPAGMRLSRQFSDAAYFTGALAMNEVLEQVGRHVQGNVELLGQRAVFSLAYVKGDATRRPLRIEVSKTPKGSQIHVKNIKAPPAVAGLSDAEAWQRAGRKPDGSLIDPNQVY